MSITKHVGAAEKMDFSNRNLDISVSLTGGSGDMHGIYFTGDKLTANVRLHVKFNTKALRVVFKYVGIAKLGMKTEKVLNEKVVLASGAKSREYIELKAANSPINYPVTIELGEQLLPTVKCKSNYVKYYCQVKIVRFLSKNTLQTSRIPFTVYQDNANSRQLVTRQQEPVDYEEVEKRLRITYQLTKTGFYMGETPTIIGTIYNAGESEAKLRVGMDVVQKFRVDGDVNLLVTKLNITKEDEQEQFARWSSRLSIPSGGSEEFTGEINLKATPPTSHCQMLDITHQVVLKLQVDRILRSPKVKNYPHDIVVARTADGRTPMKRSSSKISIGRSQKRRPSTPQVQNVFGSASDIEPSTSNRHNDRIAECIASSKRRFNESETSLQRQAERCDGSLPGFTIGCSPVINVNLTPPPYQTNQSEEPRKYRSQDSPPRYSQL